nr:hypothetical protein [Tanacetum cinerariifolium]
MPIFYDVEPFDVRKQIGEFGKGFAKHESSEQVESWRNALVAAANLSGWEPKHIANGHESKCIKEIVDTISSRLHPLISREDENLIGIEVRVQVLKLKLQIGSGGVLMIGIWGVGGGGKTTLASSVFDKISGSFAGCCFVKNIREESSKYGLEKLQEKILSGVLKQNRMEVGRVEEGRHTIKSRRRFKNTAMEMLDACGFHPVIGIKVLIQKALININLHGEFDMHDMVQEMGHYIVRGEYPNSPEKHSRVWREEDVLKICGMDTNMQLDKIEAIRYYPYRHAPLPYQINANMKKLRSIEWDGLPGSSLPTNFLTGELCFLILSRCEQIKLWEGYKFLPNLRTINLTSMMNLITTPDLKGLPNLERIVICRCWHLEEIHSSVGCLERLVSLEIFSCDNLRIFPPITRPKKLETLMIRSCPKLNQVLEIQQIHLYTIGREAASYKQYSVNPFITSLTRFFSKLGRDPGIKKQADKVATYIECGSVVGELPNLQELGVSRNKFSRINFSLLQLPRLKWLNVSGCKNLVELLELPTNIGVLKADYCHSLESIGDISNCKYLWKVSLKDAGPIVCEILDSIRQVNAIEDHFISLALPANIAMDEFVRFVRGEGFTMQLSHKYWYDDYCGFLICIVTRMFVPCFTIILKPEMGKDFVSESWQESNEAPKTDELATTYVGYVSSNLLMRHTPWWNSAYNMISISVTGKSILNDKSSSEDEIWLGGELVPRNGVQITNVATDFSKFWDDEFEDRKTYYDGK